MLRGRKLLAAGVIALAASTPAVGATLTKGLPDLKPHFNLNTGVVTVKNIGLSKSKRVYVTIRCKRIGGGSCPDPHPALAGAYENPLFPNRATVKVPQLKPGKSFSHKLKFFKKLNFRKGRYRFIVKADASNIQPESNETNNKRVFLKVVP